MKFRIESVNWYKTEEMIEHYPCLANFGLEVEKKEEPKHCRILDENGNPLIFEYGNNITYIPYITIHDIGTLIKLTKAVGHEIVFNGEENLIEIYDGYRE